MVSVIKSFEFKNFKSFHDAVLYLENLSVIVGCNASGKSNAIEGIMILSALVSENNLKQYIQNNIRGGMYGCCKHKERRFELACVCDVEGVEARYAATINMNKILEIVEEKISYIDYNGNTEIVTINYSINTPIVEIHYSDRVSNYAFDGNSSILASFPDVIYAESTSVKFSKIIQAIIKDLRNIFILSTNVASARSYNHIGDSDLKNDASNISAVLYSLCKRENSKLKNTILNIIRNLPENEIEDIKFAETPLDDVILYVKEKYSDALIDIRKLSDGTIRCLAIITALINNYLEDSSKLVIIEEIENGIHPSRAKLLIKSIIDLIESNENLVLATSHDVALLNAIKGKYLKGVSVVYRDNDIGDSIITKLYDVPKYLSISANGPLGRLMESEDIIKALKSDNQEDENYEWLWKL